ncbi:MAG TPA: AAA family ATPase, partial [Actinospica sp.]|nr:AAA family ATPase [Actinospica sp.]
ARIAEATAGWPGLAADDEGSSDEGAKREGAKGDGVSGEGLNSEGTSGEATRGRASRGADGDVPRTSIVRTTAPADILFLCGPTAVGKSTVGWFAYAGSRRLGRNTAFADLGQLGFQRPAAVADPGNHRLKAANLAALWRNFHARGARRLVVNGPLTRPEELRTYADALPAARITVCRLHASPEELAERIAQRAAGAGSARGLAGDVLFGLSGADLRAAVDAAVAESAELERVGIGDLRVVTDARDPRELADEILRRAGWS